METKDRSIFLEKVLDRHPQFDCPEWRQHLEQAASNSLVTLQRFAGAEGHLDCATLFLTHESLPREAQSSLAKLTVPRFLKSVVFRLPDLEILSVGLPHFFSLRESNLQGANFVTKLDGTCVVIDRLPEGFLLRSRRRIYEITRDLSCLNLPEMPDLGARIQSWTDWKTLTAEAIVPQSIQKLPAFYERALRSSGFCPYVSYPQPGLFVTNAIDSTDPSAYRLASQSTLDLAAQKHGFPRPKTQHFPSMAAAEAWLKSHDESEGFCVYTEHDQQIHKLKTRWYKSVHGLVSSLHALLT